MRTPIIALLLTLVTSGAVLPSQGAAARSINCIGASQLYVERAGASPDSDGTQWPAQVTSMEPRLKELRRSLKWLRKDTLIMANEVAGNQSVHSLSPNVVGSMVINAFPSPTGTVQMGPGPINVRMMHEELSDMNHQLRKIHSLEQNAGLPTESQEWLSMAWRRVLALTDDAVQHYNKMLDLSSDPDTNRIALARELIQVHDDTENAARDCQLMQSSIPAPQMLMVGKQPQLY